MRVSHAEVVAAQTATANLTEYLRMSGALYGPSRDNIPHLEMVEPIVRYFSETDTEGKAYEIIMRMASPYREGVLECANGGPPYARPLLKSRYRNISGSTISVISKIEYHYDRSINGDIMSPYPTPERTLISVGTGQTVDLVGSYSVHAAYSWDTYAMPTIRWPKITKLCILREIAAWVWVDAGDTPHWQLINGSDAKK
jgi:hypothetical protein